MGRKLTRYLKKQDKMDKTLYSQAEIQNIKKKSESKALAFNAEALLTCFALTEHRKLGFGKKRILRSLQYLDDLMGEITNGEKTIDDLKQELQDETGVKIQS